jgi:HD-like signal output (HDOD) protein
MDEQHGPLGAVLLKSWGLPSALAMISSCHHDPSELPPGTPLSRHAWIVAAAYQAVVAAGARYKDEHEEGPPLEVSAAATGLAGERIQEIATEADHWWRGLGDEVAES